MTLEVSVEFCHAWRRQCRITCLLLLNFSSNKLSGNNLLDNIYVLFTGFRQRCQVQAARHTCCWGWRDDRWARWNLRVSKLEFKFFVWKVKFLSLSLDFIDFSYLNCLVFFSNGKIKQRCIRSYRQSHPDWREWQACLSIAGRTIHLIGFFKVALFPKDCWFSIHTFGYCRPRRHRVPTKMIPTLKTSSRPRRRWKLKR